MSLIDDIRKDREAGTPGPWSFGNAFGGELGYVFEEPMKLPVAQVHGWLVDDGVANARRIAPAQQREAR